jgi:hypothetical protein
MRGGSNRSKIPRSSTTDGTCGRSANDFGLELREEHGGELIESRLSRFGEEPLLLIADQIKSNLIAQVDPTNATH